MKNPKTKLGRRVDSRSSGASASREAIKIVVPETGASEDVKASICKSVPGWDELDKEQQTELAELAQAHLKQRQPVKVTLTRKPDGSNSIGFDGKCETHGVLKLQKAFAAVSLDPVNARASELLKYLGSVGAGTTERYNAALSFIESMEPQNQAEALLLVQIYVTHDAAIRALSQLGTAEWVPTAQMFGNLATKLLRTSQGQMEALARMRRGGEQVVRHIHVDNRGGQAVIAENVQTGGKENEKAANQSLATGTAGIGPALSCADPFGNGVPVSSRERPEALPDARWDKSGSAKG